MTKNQAQKDLFKKHMGTELPIICGAMYPCSNWELLGAVAAAGGMPIIQPVSLVFAHRTDFREGIRKIKAMAPGKPIGMNVLTEQSSKAYIERMEKWVDIALEEGVRFFVTSLGNPRWIVERANKVGAVVYHDVTEKRWAQKAVDAGVHGLIAVNNRAGGHAGHLSLEALLESLSSFGLPVVCAGGVGSPEDMVRALEVGYAGVQMGTRFIATQECSAHADYKAALLKAESKDIVLTEKISGVPVAVINTPYVQKMGLNAGPIARWLLKHPKYKHYIRSFYTLKSVWMLKKAAGEGGGYKDYWQAGKSVDGVTDIPTVADLLARYRAVLRA